MGRKKIFRATDISIPEIDHSVKFKSPNIQELASNPIVLVPRNNFSRANLDFSKWYGGRIDAITYICHVQILRFLEKQDTELSLQTICALYTAATRFFTFAELRATALDKQLTAQDINRQLIDEYLSHLSGQGISLTSQNLNYSQIKCLLLPPGRRGVYNLITEGIDKTFPSNQFPNINKLKKGETSLTNTEKKSVLKALRASILPIWDDQQLLTSELLTYCLLIIALHTGRNATPLREMTSECLRAHPKDNNCFLTVWKRRGYNTSKVILRNEHKSTGAIESITSVRFSIERLIRQVISRTAALRKQHPEFEDCIWLYYSRESDKKGQVLRLSVSAMSSAIVKLVKTYDLKGSDEKPLRLNIGRLRKTFASRIFEILNGDASGTARALGDTKYVTETSYLAASKESKKKWRFMGELLVNELLTNTIGATYHQTPVAKCSNSIQGSEQTSSLPCTSFMNCIRCTHFAVTADDLYKLYSFYFRIYSERSKMAKQRWEKELSHIPRLIEHYVVEEGLRRGIFKLQQVNEAKARAKMRPHPFWSADTIPSIEAIV